jgi:hypothetical protein
MIQAQVDSRPLTRRVLVIGAAFVLAFVLLRCMHLDADAPLRFGRYRTVELFAEPPAKSHEARNWALFGSFHVNPADNYQFWRAQSPFWVYPLAGFFECFGVGYPQLRIFSSLYSALGFATLLWLAWRYLASSVAILFGMLMLLDGMYIHYSRVGLLEPAVSAWCAVAILAVVRARTHPAFIMLALSAFAAAFFTKQAAIHLVPALLIGLALSQHGSALEPRRRRKWLLVSAAFAIALLVVCLVHASGTWYTRAFAYNLATHVGGVEPVSGRIIGEGGPVWSRLFERVRYQQVLLSMPLTAPAALCTAIGIAVVSLDRRKLDLPRVVVMLWFIGASAAVMTLARTGIRFWSLAVPPAALLTAIGMQASIEWAAPRVRVPRLVPILTALVVCGQLALHGSTFRKYIARPKYSVRDAARTLERIVGDQRAVIVGSKAPGIVLSTPYLNYYVRTGFNFTRDAIRSLGITHALLLDKSDHTGLRLMQAYPELLNGVVPLLSLKFQGAPMKLYDVAGRFGADETADRTLGMLPK